MGDDYAAQVRALDEGALVRALPELGTLLVTGDDRSSWLSGMLTSDIVKLRPGEGAYALSVNKTGRVQTEAWVLIDETRILLAVPGELVESVREALDHYLIMEDAEIATAPERWSWWLAHGPQAPAIVEVARGVGAIAATASLGRCPSAIIAAPPEADRNLGEILTNPPGSLLATPEAWDRIRIERLLPAFGVDFEPEVYPQEASLEDLAVSFDKGCYLGQEAVYMLQKRGRPPRRIVTLALEGAALPAHGADVESGEGARVGELTSAVAVDGAVRALATVKQKYAEPGTVLSIDGRSAQVVTPTAGFHS